MKRIIMILAVLALGVSIFASSAGAAITITPAPGGPGYQNLSPWTCDGRTFYASGDPIRLAFGWGAHTTSQMRGFFQNSHGTVSITGSDSFADSWANSPTGDPFVSAQGIPWSPLAPQTLTPPGGGTTVEGVSSSYRGVLAIAPGTYTLTVAFVFDRPVQDGFGVYRGTLTGSCTFNVV